MTDLLQDSIAFLKKSGSNGKNLYDHLSDVIVKILEQKPENVYTAFENVSLYTNTKISLIFSIFISFWLYTHFFLW